MYGIWEVNGNGFSKNGTGFSKITGVGKGGSIQRMQIFVTEILDHSTYVASEMGYIHSR